MGVLNDAIPPLQQLFWTGAVILVTMRSWLEGGTMVYSLLEEPRCLFGFG
jgi:hypothetical protein